MTTLVGKVRSGAGDLSDKMRTVPGLLEAYYAKTGLRLYPGSLNVELEKEWSMPPRAIRLEQQEYGGTVAVSLLPCRIGKTKAYIVRTDKCERGEGTHHPKTIIEIISDIPLRKTYGLKDGDRIEVVITDEIF